MKTDMKTDVLIPVGKHIYPLDFPFDPLDDYGSPIPVRILRSPFDFIFV